jgi:hypothetical protein
MKTKFWEDKILGIGAVRLSQGLVLVVSIATELHCLFSEKWGAHDAAENEDAIANDEYYSR